MHPRYNPRYPMNSKPRLRSAAWIAAVLALCAAAQAADWTQPATQLARDIVAITGPGAVSVTYRNQSTLPGDQMDAVRRAIENQLRAGGVRLAAAANAAAEVRITFSENLHGYVWVAEVQQGSDVRVAMVAADRLVSATGPARQASMTLRKTLLWSQPAQVLDVAVQPAGSEPILLVLDTAGVTISKKIGTSWMPQQTLAIARDAAWPRDARGRISLARDHMFDAYLPGVICSSNSAGSSLALNCRNGDDPWPLAPGQSAFFAPTRNFFTGVLAPAVGRQGSVAPFYSAAALPRPRYSLWVFARTDGSVHALDGMNDIPLRTISWGSDLAAVNSGCSLGTQLLVSGPGDRTAPDAVRVFEIADREPLEVTSAAEFNGPITALWPSADGHSAVAVVHNLKTDHYDAFELAIHCGQ